MNTMFSQSDRQGRLTTVLGTDALVLLRMDGSEELSGFFEWRIEALATKSDVDLHALLGSHASVEISHAVGTRAFDGIVTAARAMGGEENGWRYDLTLRPWLHVAGLRRNMRIFHNKTVLDIVKEVLGAYSSLGAPHVEVRTTGSYPVLEYTVQYGETDADFVCRQLERHGISWMWTHEPGNHTMVLVDSVDSLPTVPGGKRPFYGVGEYHRHEEEHFHRWQLGDRMTTGEVRLTDYNFKTPLAAQEVSQTGDATHAHGTVESYDWPGDYLDQAQGKDVVRRRIEEERGQAERHSATGDVITLEAGGRVTLVGDEVPGASKMTFVCLKATHRFRAQAYGSGDPGSDETPYEGDYVLMPESAPFRPERRTVGPRVQGPETAVVVGEGEIDCDEYGRILCRFHWDDTAAHTMRVRVSQNWASKGWGGMVIPRIGMEVIVEHLRGDPDKPIVTGCVYNGANMPPYELPTHKTKSTFMTDTHQGEGFNELRFEDENGQEEIRVHAQKDMNEIVRNHAAQLVLGNKQTSVRHNFSTEVFGDEARTNLGSLILSVGSSHLAGLQTGNLGAATDKISTAGYRMDRNMSHGGNGDYSIILDGAMSTSVGDMCSLIVAKDQVTDIGGTRSYKARGSEFKDIYGTSMQRFHKSLRMRVTNKVIIVCGSSRFEMDSAGSIKLTGVNIDLNASSQVRIKAPKIDMN